jgi:hypothetical protein
MRFWLGLMLAAGLATTALAAHPRDDDEDEDDTPPPAKKSSSWWPSWMSFGAKAEKKETLKPALKPAPMRESPAAVRAREMEDWLRRVAVCTRLHQIAAETNDAELERRATDLEQKAFAIYQERTAALPSGPMRLPNDDLDDDDGGSRRRSGTDARRSARSRRSDSDRAAIEED